jgi:3',5'-cyclic AMP phosphodiesterase CpdA
MLIAHISDTHIKTPGKKAYGRVDTAKMLQRCVQHLLQLRPQPDLVVLTGDLVVLGQPEEYAHLQQLLSPLHLPLVVVPGNHDARDAMRQAFAHHRYLPATGFLHFSLDDAYPLRIIGLDTLVPFEGRGELCAERLAWLETTLAQAPEQPTLVLMHHPPFLTGIAHMDALGLTGREAFATILARHPQVQAVLCGHLHRHIHTRVGGHSAMTAPSPAHQVVLDLDPLGPSQFCMEPPGYLLHRWLDGQFLSHSVVLGEHEGPYPFHDASGQLIDE